MIHLYGLLLLVLLLLVEFPSVDDELAELSDVDCAAVDELVDDDDIVLSDVNETEDDEVNESTVEDEGELDRSDTDELVASATVEEEESDDVDSFTVLLELSVIEDVVSTSVDDELDEMLDVRESIVELLDTD